MDLKEEAAALGLPPEHVEQLALFCRDNAERQEAARQIVGLLAGALGTWTRERPQRPGLYWMKGPDREPRNIVRVEDSTGKLRAKPHSKGRCISFLNPLAVARLMACREGLRGCGARSRRNRSRPGHAH